MFFIFYNPLQLLGSRPYLSDFHEGLLYNCYVNDTLYSVPFLRSTSLLYLNTTILEQAGVDPESITTWDNFAEACEKIHQTTGKYGVSYPINYWYTEAFMLTNGGFPISADGAKCTVDNEVSRAVNSYWMDLIDKGRAHLYLLSESDKMTADVMNQDTAMWFSSTGGLTSFIKVAQGRPNNPGYTEFQVELTNAISEITVNRADEDATLAALERKGNELFNE